MGLGATGRGTIGTLFGVALLEELALFASPSDGGDRVVCTGVPIVCFGAVSTVGAGAEAMLDLIDRASSFRALQS